MLRVTSVLRNRRRQKLQEQRSPMFRLGLGCSAVFALAGAVLGLLLAVLYTSLARGLPSLALLPELLDPPDGLLLQPTRLYDRSGENLLLSLENPAAGPRLALSLDTQQADYLPPVLISTTLAVVQPDFWSNPLGISLGESTVAQQLAGELLLWDELPGLRRTLRTRLLAVQLTLTYGKERLLAWYLNSLNYGRLAFGAHSAAQVYFGKPASRLSLAEAAVLATAAEAPALNPLDAPQAARERALVVLQRSEAAGLITTRQAAEALAQPVRFANPAPAEPGPAPIFARLALDQLGKRYQLLRIERGGLRIVTTLDYALQLQTECAVRSQLARLQGQPAPQSALDGTTCQAARLLPTLPTGQITAGAALAGSGASLSAASLIYDPRQGQLLALVGDPAPGLDPTRLPARPPGTLLTPLIALTGYTRGLAPASLVWDIPHGPAALQDSEYRGPMRLRLALANDRLSPLLQVMEQVGAENVWRTARQLGLELGDAGLPGLDSLLETQEVALMELAQAYGAMANQGVLVGVHTPQDSQMLEPLVVLRVEEVSGRLWPASVAGSTVRPLINPQLAYLLNHTLSDETARWPSLGHPNPLEIGRTAAAKLGRTLSGRDTWALGYTPARLVAAWVGYRSPQEAPAALEPLAAAGLWHALMQHSLADLPFEDWSLPPGISRVEVCELSGLLPTEACPNRVGEVFLTGTEPNQGDNLHRIVPVNRETERLATVFTPPELVEERTYLLVPPEAAAWAEQAGLPLPPQTYDLAQSGTGSDEAVIALPEVFAYVRGLVPIFGTAGGQDFAYYRLQAGQGLNPKQWLQIGEQSEQTVSNGLLGRWDTTGLDGLYAIQLLVVTNEQRVRSAVTQVAVDNQQPEILAIYPGEGQAVKPGGRSLVFTAEASDNLALAVVEFYLDGELVAAVENGPYIADWNPLPGEHNLRVRAVDRAGNSREQTVRFSVNP